MSAIEEYYLCSSNNKKSSEQNIEEHLDKQDLLLNTIQKQSKPCFFRDVSSNIVGNFIYDAVLFGIKKIIR